MTTNWHFPFNVFSWSTAILILFLLIQAVVVTAYAATGYSPSPTLALFTWGAVSAAISFGLVSRCDPTIKQLLVLQGFACFYMLCVSVAVTLKTRGALSASLVSLLAGSIVALFASGAIGVALARMIRGRLPR